VFFADVMVELIRDGHHRVAPRQLDRRVDLADRLHAE